MRVFAVVGVTRSGKTKTIEHIIRELRRRKYTVGSVKDIHFEQFAMDTPGTNTDRHHRAGSQLVTARGLEETDVLYKERLQIRDVLRHYHHDFVVLEGVEDPTIPRILTIGERGELPQEPDGAVFALSGRLAAELDEYGGLPALSAPDSAEELVDLIEAKTFPILPDIPVDCCGACGYDCATLTAMILRGEADRSLCPVVSSPGVRLVIGDEDIPMAPFVQAILRNAVEGVARELDGYRPHSKISVQLDPGE